MSVSCNHPDIRNRYISSTLQIVVGFSLLSIAVIHAKEPPGEREDRLREQTSSPPLPLTEEEILELIKNQPPATRPAHVPSPPIPWTEAELNPDVGKRPRFVAALNLQRKNYGTFWIAEPDLAAESIPDVERAEFEQFLAHVVTKDCQAPLCDPNAIYSAYRGGSTEAEIETVTWETAFGTLRAVRGRNGHHFSVRLKVSPEQRLMIRATVPEKYETRGPIRGTVDGKRFFDQDALYSLITGVFRFPYLGPDDFVIHGNVQEYEGVRVLVGSIISRRWPGGEIRDAKERPEPPWYARVRLLVTDSDPQYFRLAIDFRQEAKRIRAMP